MMKKIAQYVVVCFAAAGLVLGAAAGAGAAKKAKATLTPKNISLTSGTVFFEEVSGGVEVTATIVALIFGKHGFHIHAKGDCFSFDGLSAGEHFNPKGVPHGPPGSGHAGDLGNVVANEFGVVNLKKVFKGITISPGPTSIAGRSVIVHVLPDDGTTQPTGGAGVRIACGVIGVIAD